PPGGQTFRVERRPPRCRHPLHEHRSSHSRQTPNRHLPHDNNRFSGDFPVSRGPSAIKPPSNFWNLPCHASIRFFSRSQSFFRKTSRARDTLTEKITPYSPLSKQNRTVVR